MKRSSFPSCESLLCCFELTALFVTVSYPQQEQRSECLLDQTPTLSSVSNSVVPEYQSVYQVRIDRSTRGAKQQEDFEDEIFKRIVRPETDSRAYTRTVQADREYRSGFRTLKTF